MTYSIHDEVFAATTCVEDAVVIPEGGCNVLTIAPRQLFTGAEI